MNDLSSNVATGGLNRDSGGDSAGVASMSTPNKKSRSDPDGICLDTMSSDSIDSPTMRSHCNHPDAEEKMRLAAAALPGVIVGAEAQIDNNNDSANEVKSRIALSNTFSDPINFINKCFPGMHESHPLTLSSRESLRGMRETANDAPIFNHTMVLPVQAQTPSFTQEAKTANIKSGDRKCVQIILLIFKEAADGCTKKAAGTRFSF